MKEVSISVKIAGVEYPVKVKPADEIKVIKAAVLVNDKIKELKDVYQVHDRKDLLAMCALQLAIQHIEQENENLSDNGIVSDKLTEIEGFISNYLKKEKV